MMETQIALLTYPSQNHRCCDLILCKLYCFCEARRQFVWFDIDNWFCTHYYSSSIANILNFNYLSNSCLLSGRILKCYDGLWWLSGMPKWRRYSWTEFWRCFSTALVEIPRISAISLCVMPSMRLM